MIDLVLVKKDMLHYVRLVRGIGKGLSDNHIVLCKVRLVGTWIKRREAVHDGRRIRSEKLREHQYIKGYAKCFDSLLAREFQLREGVCRSNLHPKAHR